MKRFGDLVALLRVDPGNDAAQDLALAAACRAVSARAVSVEGGVERGIPDDGLSLSGRLRARQIDALHVAAGASARELLVLARALSHDTTPVVASAHVRIEALVAVARAGFDFTGGPASDPLGPPRDDTDRRHWLERRRAFGARWRAREHRTAADRRARGERRLRALKHHEIEIAQLLNRLDHAALLSSWKHALELADCLRAYAPRVPAEARRTFGIVARRHLPPAALDGMVGVALREPGLRNAAAGVLQWAGLAGAEVMLAAICRSEGVAGSEFLYDALGEMDEAFVCVAPLLASLHWHEVRHAALILGRQRRPEALEPLQRRLGHGDERVRAAVLHALAEFPLDASADAFRSALAHPSAGTRAAAAAALARPEAAAFADALTSALRQERDAAAWAAVARALGAIASADTCDALASAALARRKLFAMRGFGVTRRRAAVAALARASGGLAAAALERVAREGDAPVREAARAALASRYKAVTAP
ncbi:MAG TPA: HEAT repeat domain-containing protein [Gemmatimonadales bacterium]|nr:HEAT repeat domain-containing protein [Gemmatimonadales bacterium]